MLVVSTYQVTLCYQGVVGHHNCFASLIDVWLLVLWLGHWAGRNEIIIVLAGGQKTENSMEHGLVDYITRINIPFYKRKAVN